MPLFGEKPVTSITIKINQMSEAHRYDDDDDIDDTLELHLSNLLELIKIQPSSGATEAARAIRKKIKYGESVDEQLRALNILELLILNSGRKIGPVIARDDKLIDVLKGILGGNGRTGIGASYDKDVQDKVRNLAIGWKTELEELEGYKYFACLWQFIPKNSKSRSNRPSSRSISSPRSTPRDIDANDDDDDDYGTGNGNGNGNGRRSRHNTNGYEDDEDFYSQSPPSSRPKSPRTPRSPPPPRPKTASPYSDNTKDKKKDKDKKKRKKTSSKRPGIRYADEEFEIPQINYTLEAPKIRTLIGQCHTHTTALNNALITLPANESPAENEKIQSEFDKCKKIRRKVLRYLQFVGAGGEEHKTPEIRAMDEEFLGSLIGANELLVETFKAFDKKCGVVSAGPAPTYGEEEVDEDDESYSGESYYTSDDEDDYEEESEQSISQRLENTTIEGSSRDSPVAGRKSPPPPRPAKPSKLVSRYTSENPPPPKQSTRKITAPISAPADDNDPFGDSNEVSHVKSIYD